MYSDFRVGIFFPQCRGFINPRWGLIASLSGCVLRRLELSRFLRCRMFSASELQEFSAACWFTMRHATELTFDVLGLQAGSPGTAMVLSTPIGSRNQILLFVCVGLEMSGIRPSSWNCFLVRLVTVAAPQELQRARIDLDEIYCFFVFLAGFAIGSKARRPPPSPGMWVPASSADMSPPPPETCR